MSAKFENSLLMKDIAEQLEKNSPDLSPDERKEAIRVLFSEISNALIMGDKVELRGFGSLSLKIRNSKYARNPSTNEEIERPNHPTVYFRPSRAMLDKLNSEK